MMERVMLAPSDEDDIYSGYNEFHPALDTRNLQRDESFQQAVLKSSYGRRGTNTGYKTSEPSRMGTVGYRRNSLTTSSKRHIENSNSFQAPSTARPVTAVRGAGYTSQGNRNQTMFDPLNQAKSIGSSLVIKDETTPEAKLKQLEKKIHDLLEDSCLAAHRKEFTLSLDKAKESVSKERSFNRMREQSGLTETIPPNTELTFSVIFNLAIQYTNNDMFLDAINTYQSIIKNRIFTNTARLKLNIGYIYYKQGNYPKAIKFFRMALDQIPNVNKELRLKIMHNIGLAFVKLNQYADAITSFEYIMSEKIDTTTALHLMVCNYALGDKEKMKRWFNKLLEVKNENLFEDKYALNDEEHDDPTIMMSLDAMKSDQLGIYEKERKRDYEWCVLTGAKLISPVIGDTFSTGYDWCVEQIRNSSYTDLANDLEINKAVKHLRKREYNEAIVTLKSFEKKDSTAASIAATNLSFLYILQNDLSLAEKYSDDAINANRYNAGALINKGNCYFKHNDYERAKEYYKEALAIESGCLEAIYNLALTYKKIGQYDNALDYMFKLQTLTKNHCHVLFQIANIYELSGDKNQAMDFYQQLINFVPSDPSLLSRISDIADAEHDKQQALSYLSDSYRYFPSHIPTIERLAAYYIENKIYEKAVKYLERASQVQPNQIKWQLMIAACHRRGGNYQQAFNCYKSIHNRFPENIECLKFLVRVSSDLGLNEAIDYAEKLKKLEKSKELKERAASSLPSRSASRASARRSAASSREGSASSSSSGYLTSGSPRSTASKKNLRKLENENNKNIVDMSVYEDLAVANERPTTSWKRNNNNNNKDDDDFANDEIDDILPE